MKKLLYLYNDGYRAFPHLGRGGLGYKPPIKIIGDGLHPIFDTDTDTYEMYDDGNYEDPTIYEQLDGSRDSLIRGPITERLYEWYEGPGDQVQFIEDDDDDNMKIQKMKDTLAHDEEQPQYEAVDYINEYIEKWSNGDTLKKRELTLLLKNKYDFTDDQKKQIDKIKNNKKTLEQKKEMLSKYLKSEKIVISEEEEAVEGFEPEPSAFIPMTIDQIKDTKDTDMTFDDIGDYISDDYINMLNDFDGIKDNPFEYLYEGYEDLIKTYDIKDVENLLYDNTGNFKPGLDFEHNVLKNEELVKEILISTYGEDNIDLSNLKYNYDAKDDLFTVFDAHAISFKLKNSNGIFEDKEAFIEFKKYSNYTKQISNLDNMIYSEEIRFNKFIYEIMDKIHNINENLETAITYENNKDIKKYKKELKEYLSKNNLNDLEELKTKFYKELDPLGVGVKYTKFPQLEQTITRPDDSVNTQAGYNYLLQYEGNIKRRKASNISTHQKAKNENIDILVCTGLKNAMVAVNLSDIFRKHPGQNHIDYLHLKKTVYASKQKGSKKYDYDHFNVPITYFKNVNLSKFLNKKKKEFNV